MSINQCRWRKPSKCIWAMDGRDIYPEKGERDIASIYIHNLRSKVPVKVGNNNYKSHPFLFHQSLPLPMENRYA